MLKVFRQQVTPVTLDPAEGVRTYTWACRKNMGAHSKPSFLQKLSGAPSNIRVSCAEPGSEISGHWSSVNRMGLREEEIVCSI